ncbi:MAG: hypothetical protein NVV68_01110 [Dokdonella sp.]|nr:hypothetical protein [Dokdonella sp.]
MGPPISTRVPPGFSACRVSRSEWLPTLSRIRIVALGPLGEVVLRVVDHVVGAERAHQRDVARAAHAGHLGAERLGDLHREAADAARRTVDQHLVAGAQAAGVAQTLQRGRRGDRQRGGFLEAQLSRLGRDQALLAHHDVVGQCAAARAEHVLADRPARDGAADRLDGAGEIDAGAHVGGPAEPGRQPHHVRSAGHLVHVERVQRRGMHAHQHLVIGRHRLADPGQPEHLAGAVAGMDHRAHRVRPPASADGAGQGAS